MSGKSTQIRESVIILITVLFILLLISFKGTAQNVGIGTASPHASAQLDVSSTTKGILIPRMTSAERNAIVSPANGLLVYYTNYGRIWYYTGSRWVDLLSSDLSLQDIYYDWKKDAYPEMQFSSNRQIGFSAQEVEKLFPEVVITDNTGYKSIDYAKLTPVAIQAIKEQQQQIDGLKKNQDRMQEEISELKNLVEKLLKK